MSRIINKAYKNYNKISRYAVFPYYYNSLDDKYMYGLTSHLKNEDTKYVNHKIKQNETLDSIALYYYNNPTYYWIIADFNRIQDPFEKLEIGRVLRIPTFSNIKFDI